MDIGLRRSGLSLDDQYIKSPAPTPARAGDHFLVANDGAAVVPGCFSPGAIASSEKATATGFLSFSAGGHAGVSPGGVGGCRETPPFIKLKALMPHYRR